MNAAVSIVALVALGLAGLVGFELLAPPGEPEPVPAGRPPVAGVQAALPVSQAVSHVAGRVADEVLLARPLFSQTRRPPNVASPAATSAVVETLPRMTGILIDGPNRRAIFAGGEGGRAITVVEGGHLGAFTVTSIEPRQVTVTGPGGSRTLRTAFDLSLPPPAPSAVPSFVPPQFPGIQVPGGPSSGRVLGGFVPPSVPSSPFISQPSTPGVDAGNGSSPGAAR